MKILYNGIFCENGFVEEIKKGNGEIYPFAQQKFEKLILSGIKFNNFNEDVTVLSTRPVIRYPKNKKIIMKKKQSKENGININYLSFINLPILKQITIFFSIIKQILLWSKENKKEEKKVIIYGTNPLNIIPYLLLRKSKRYKIVSIVTEIDRLRLLEKRNIILKIKNYIYIKLSNIIEDRLDGYVLVCKNMNELINKRNKPYIVVEGMVTAENYDRNIQYMNKDNTIMYAGTLDKRYGINKLVEAFEKIKDNKYKLLIYGNGDYKQELIDKSKKNSSIIYGGVVSNNEIIQQEKKAKILINPRPSNEEFTRYSFPSKTLEYFSVGTVALITRLEGIPDEYFKYCYVFENEDEEGFIKAILSLINKPNEELENKAFEALNFVKKNKNNIVQTKKILDFVEKI
ncbi:MAG: glycosyltransferase [Clostridia bacterium]|nr:glycosyltransferase [Clostridia bacterium]